MIELPVPSHVAKFSETVSMDRVTYRLTFTWNIRVAAWYMTIAEHDGTVIATGVKIVPHVALLYRHKDERLPKGMVFALDLEDGSNAPRVSRTGLGRKVRLYYIPEDEFRAL